MFLFLSVLISGEPALGQVLAMLYLAALNALRSFLLQRGHAYSHCIYFFPVLNQVQKKNYRQEKKRATKQLFSALKDPSVVITADWLKVFHTDYSETVGRI